MCNGVKAQCFRDVIAKTGFVTANSL